MNVLITGAGGYIGQALSQRLAAPAASLAGRPIDRLTLCDLDIPGAPAGTRVITGSVADATVIESLMDHVPDVVYHLASVPSGRSETDHELGLAVNLQATLDLLAALRRRQARPVVVFTSSIAVFGAPLPAHIDDDTPLRPALSYGAQKQVVEILLADATRRGQLQARSLRLPGVVARPPTPTGALSAFSSELIRALVAGHPYVCPVSPAATLWLLSLTQCIDNLVHAAQLNEAQHDGHTCWTLPALRLSVADLVAAFERQGADSTLIRYAPDVGLEAQFGNLPPLQTRRAERAGFHHDGTVDVLVQRATAALAASASPMST